MELIESKGFTEIYEILHVTFNQTDKNYHQKFLHYIEIEHADGQKIMTSYLHVYVWTLLKKKNSRKFGILAHTLPVKLTSNR